MSFALYRGTGHTPDEHDPNDWGTGRLFGGVERFAYGLLPTEHSLERLIVPGLVRDQLFTESCVGQALAMAIYLRLLALQEAGLLPLRLLARYPSAQGLYTLARALARAAGQYAQLQDRGAYPRKAMLGLQTYGVPYEDEWLFNPATINEEPSQAQLETGFDFLLGNYFRNDLPGKAGVEEGCRGFAADLPMVGGTLVNRAFNDYRGGVLTAPGDDDPGVAGHYLAFIGYKTVGGKRVIRGVNSWGRGWGEDGLFWCDEAFFEALADRYFLTINDDPRFRAEPEE